MPERPMKKFSKSFTQQEPIPQTAIERVSEILATGKLHRYNVAEGELSEASLLEQEYAEFQKAPFCIAVTSGGQAMQIALRALGIKPDDKILANAYTLAPVPGAMFAVGAEPIFVEIDKNWHIDLDDLEEKATTSKAKYLMLSHMRGHIADMDAISKICKKHEISMIEDCAHTMGAKWQGEPSGNFGKIACFSTQTYKHINSGEGGLITTFDPIIAARAVIISGSYMLYEKHGAITKEDIFNQVKLQSPNCSARLDNVRAALIRHQLPSLEENIRRWNERYSIISAKMANQKNVLVPERKQYEEYVGSSFQFQLEGLNENQILEYIGRCAARGIEIKWFGAEEPKAFTSRYDSWKYLENLPDLPKTKQTLFKTCDIRIPLTFDKNDCQMIAEIMASEL